MTNHKTIFTTERSERHQQIALRLAPPELAVTMLRQPDRATLLTHLDTAEYWISERVGAIDASLIEAAPQLKLILRLGSLTHDIDLAAAHKAGVIVCTWPQGDVIRVAEHVIMQMLVLGKKVPEAERMLRTASPEWGPSRRTDENTFAYNWTRRTNVTGLWRSTVGIVGFGEIGAEVARRLRSWEVKLLYHKRRQLPAAVADELGLTYAAEETLLQISDYVVNLLPYSASTDRWFNAARLQRMKAGAHLVSCGSGSVIDEGDLAAALQQGHLAGAALDTYEWEPLPADNPLLALAQAGYNLLLTPHIAAGAAARYAEERADNYTNISKHLRGQPIQYRVV